MRFDDLFGAHAQVFHLAGDLTHLDIRPSHDRSFPGIVDMTQVVRCWVHSLPIPCEPRALNRAGARYRGEMNVARAIHLVPRRGTASPKSHSEAVTLLAPNYIGVRTLLTRDSYRRNIAITGFEKELSHSHPENTRSKSHWHHQRHGSHSADCCQLTSSLLLQCDAAMKIDRVSHSRHGRPAEAVPSPHRFHRVRAVAPLKHCGIAWGSGRRYGLAASALRPMNASLALQWDRCPQARCGGTAALKANQGTLENT
jgi:hypothetical protein